MEPTIKSGKHLAENADLTETSFHNVNMSQADFDDVNLRGTRFHNVNLSEITVTAAQIGGATFKHIGLPPGSTGKQRPLRFEEADLNGTTILRCDLSGAKIEKCNVQGMTIDGILVTDLIAALNRQKK